MKDKRIVLIILVLVAFAVSGLSLKKGDLSKAEEAVLAISGGMPNLLLCNISPTMCSVLNHAEALTGLESELSGEGSSFPVEAHYLFPDTDCLYDLRLDRRLSYYLGDDSLNLIKKLRELELSTESEKLLERTYRGRFLAFFKVQYSKEEGYEYEDFIVFSISDLINFRSKNNDKIKARVLDKLLEEMKSYAYFCKVEQRTEGK